MAQTATELPLEATTQAPPPATAAPWLPPVGEAPDAAAVAAAVPAAAATAVPARFGLDATAFIQHFDFEPQFAAPQVRGSSNYLRGVLNFRRSMAVATGIDATISNRLDYLLPLNRFDGSERRGAINALREAYVSVRLDPASVLTVDIGRINLRNGVGAGYNPTDFFKEAAVITTTSRDPGALRYNRLGTVMAALNYAAGWGSATVAVVPELQSRTSIADLALARPAFYLGLDRTNAAGAFFAKVSPRLSDAVSLDLLAYLRNRRDPSFGLDTSVLLATSLVGNVEVAVIRGVPLRGVGEAVRPPRWSARLAANLTWTTPIGVEVTAELTYAGDALDKLRWDNLRRASDPASIGLLQLQATERGLEQEPLTRAGYFLYAGWRDAFRRAGLGLAAFVTGNVYDRSALWQISASQAFGAWTVGAIASGVSGSGATEFGAAAQRTYAALSLTRRF